jgi:long-subunit fatty acid transport protein
MRFIKRYTKSMVMSFFVVSIVSVSLCKNVIAEDEVTLAFPDTWTIRVGAYIIDKADTTVVLLNDIGIGGGINFSNTLGGEDSDTVPRLDVLYRFNKKHAIDISVFSIDRQGSTTLSVDLDIGNETFFASETLNSDIKYTLYRIGYNYSFYHSDKVELRLTAGLNITDYELKFEVVNGGKLEKADVSVPLPLFGLRMGYAITPKWYVNYVAETFFIEIEDEFKGNLFSYELNTEYRLFKHFSIGAGLARLGIDADIEDDDWKGSVTDSYRGFTAFGKFYF